MMSAPSRHDLPSSPLSFIDLEPVSPLDHLIFHSGDLFTGDRQSLEQLQFRLIAEALTWHYERNQDYRAYCHRLNFLPDSLHSPADLSGVPLITSTQFKLREVLSCPGDQIVKRCVSSGTQGTVSRVYRDETTMCRFLGSIQTSVDQVLQVDDAYCLHLGPSRTEAGDLWFSFVMSVTDLLFPTEHFVVNGAFHPQALVQRLLAVRHEYPQVVLIGAPIMFLHLAGYIAENQIDLGDCHQVLIITGGGWKRAGGQAISRAEFDRRIQACFPGLPATNLRDFYNAVELNTVLPECEHRVKHAPPWLRVEVLHPETLAPLPVGEMGLLAFLDPTTTSYPGLILTDDFVRLSLDGTCACGRFGRGIEMVRRVQSVDQRGCALKIDRNRYGGHPNRS